MCYFPVNYFIVLLPTKYLFIVMQISEYDITNEIGEHSYRHDRVKNCALIISCYVLTLFFIHTTSTCIVRLGDICSALRYSNQYFVSQLVLSNGV